MPPRPPSGWTNAWRVKKRTRRAAERRRDRGRIDWEGAHATIPTRSLVDHGRVRLRADPELPQPKHSRRGRAGNHGRAEHIDRRILVDHGRIPDRYHASAAVRVFARRDRPEARPGPFRERLVAADDGAWPGDGLAWFRGTARRSRGGRGLGATRG